MVRWVVGSISRGETIELKNMFLLFQPVLHNWCNKDRDIDYPVCGVVHIKDSLLPIGKNSPCSDSSGFLLLLCV